jgi:hypothetical protein
MITGLKERVTKAEAALKEAKAELKQKNADMYVMRLRIQYSTERDVSEQYKVMEQL